MRLNCRSSLVGFFALFFAPTSIVVHCSFADELDEFSNQALLETQHILVDQKSRQNAIAQSAASHQADSQVRSIAGNPQNVQQMYQISSDVFGDIVKKSQGNPAQVEETVDDLKSNPQNLYQNISENSRLKIKELSEKISNERQR
jgi:hypothetical protein